MTLNVAIVIERANIALGGAERSVFELATALRNLDIRVDVLAAKGQTKTANIHILCPDASGKRTSFAAFSEALHRTKHPGIVPRARAGVCAVAMLIRRRTGGGGR